MCSLSTGSCTWEGDKIRNRGPIIWSVSIREQAQGPEFKVLIMSQNSKITLALAWEGTEFISWDYFLLVFSDSCSPQWLMMNWWFLFCNASELKLIHVIFQTKVFSMCVRKYTICLKYDSLRVLSNINTFTGAFWNEPCALKKGVFSILRPNAKCPQLEGSYSTQ